MLFIGFASLAQDAQTIPNAHAPGEAQIDRSDFEQERSVTNFTTPPPFEVRTMAEWEEIQSLVITWAGFSRILKQIAFHAKQECEVIIMTDNDGEVISYLNGNNEGGAPFDNLDNISIIETPINSIWGRDYGAHTIYRDDVDELMLVDWIYNRNRPADDATPSTIADFKSLDLYSTTEPPYDLMATGGNFMSDGMGTAFSSNLIFDENEGGFAWSGQYYPDHSEEAIDGILQEFMGINRYINMDVLPYDAIHHIDMHMKLLDEETIIMGQYPDGVADGPQIEANLEYVLDNYNSSFGTPYKIVRVQMPPENGSYPNTNGAYRTYTNMVFVNKTVLVPIYEEQYDTPALAIIQEHLPGYNVQGIECNDIIQLLGAIHCITKAVGVADPLLIVHDDLEDTDVTDMDYVVDATMHHVSGIAAAQLYYRTSTGDFTSTEMNLTNAAENIWSASIPAQSVGTTIEYYVSAQATSGKQQFRPIVAPEGFWTFDVLDNSVGIEELSGFSPVSAIYPNPANAITAIRLELPQGSRDIRIELQDMLGRVIQEIYKGDAIAGESRYFIDASLFLAGSYHVVVTLDGAQYRESLIIR